MQFFMMDEMNSKSDACFCPCCETEVSAFRNWSPEYQNVVCPACDSHPRHRLFWLFVERHGLLRGSRLTVLHFAPETVLRRRLSSIPDLTYCTADLEQPGVDVLLDVTSLPYRNECVDVVLCSHVLSSVNQDRVVLRELFRILKPGGWAWLQVPLDNWSATTLEDPTVTDPRERERLYWDEHNVRRYGRDFADRVRTAGFSFVEEDFTRGLDAEQARRYGLHPEETLYFGTRGNHVAWPFRQ